MFHINRIHLIIDLVVISNYKYLPSLPSVVVIWFILYNPWSVLGLALSTQTSSII